MTQQTSCQTPQPSHTLLVVLLGLPGAGKTTLARSLCQLASSNQGVCLCGFYNIQLVSMNQMLQQWLVCYSQRALLPPSLRVTSFRVCVQLAPTTCALMTCCSWRSCSHTQTPQVWCCMPVFAAQLHASTAIAQHPSADLAVLTVQTHHTDSLSVACSAQMHGR